MEDLEDISILTPLSFNRDLFGGVKALAVSNVVKIGEQLITLKLLLNSL